MNWSKFSSELCVGGISVPVRSLKFQDEIGQLHRYRVCTVWNLENDKFTRRPAKARLVRDKQGKIGVVVTGGGAGFVKIGRSKAVQHTVVASLGAISKKASRKLLKQIEGEVFEDDDTVIAREG